MKIIWKPNPLETIIEIDDVEKKLMKANLVIYYLKEKLYSAKYEFENGNKEQLYREFNLENGWDDWVNSYFEDLLLELSDVHIGDCTCVPCSCGKCRAEELLEINTIKGLYKRGAEKIQSAFAKGMNLDEVIIHLKNYDAIKALDEEPDAWGNKDSDSLKRWKECAPRWKKEAEEAYKWLVKYREEHF